MTNTNPEARDVIAAVKFAVWSRPHGYHIAEPVGDERADAIIAALAAEGMVIVRAHKWHKPKGIDYDCCSDCGIVRRADDRNRPCIGPVRVGLRHHEPLKDEYTEGATPTLPPAGDER